MEDYDYPKPIKNEYQRRYLGTHSGHNFRPVLLIPVFVPMFKSLTCAVFLSQILYWTGKGKNSDWVYKTIKEMRSETGLSRRQQDNAISVLERLGVITKKLTRSIPPKRNFRVKIDKLDKLFSDYAKGYEKQN